MQTWLRQPTRRFGRRSILALIVLIALPALACGPSGRDGPPTQPPPDTAEPPPTTAPIETTTPPTVAPAVTDTPAPCLPDATFVRDVTIPDNTAMTPGQSFTKVWQIRSSGCAPWPAGTRWVFRSGDRMGAPDSVAAPQVALGSSVDVAVNMTAPNDPGTYRGYWQMQASDGTLFGDRAYVLIVVSAPATPTPTLAPPSISFTADRYSIRTGECAVITWLVTNVNAIFYRGQPVTGAESRVECPTATTTYELQVQHRDGSWESRYLTITVLPAY